MSRIDDIRNQMTPEVEAEIRRIYETLNAAGYAIGMRDLAALLGNVEGVVRFDVLADFERQFYANEPKGKREDPSS